MRFLRRGSGSRAPARPSVAAYGLDWEVPDLFNFTADVVEPLAADPGRLALTFVDARRVVERLTFAQIAHRAAAWAEHLRGRGLEPGDRVLVLLGKRPEWHAVVLGALKAGLVVVPCSEMLRPNDLAYRARHSGARLLVCSSSTGEHARATQGMIGELDVVVVEDVADRLRSFLGSSPTHPTAHDDPALILYTSGTTKEPKGVTHTHAFTYASRMQAEVWLDAHPDDLVWCTAGTGWAKSIWNVLLGPWSLGAEVVVHEGPFDPSERLHLLEHLGVTVLCQAPTEYRLLAKLDDLHRYDLGRLRHAVSAGEPLNPEVISVFRETFGVTVYDGYGQTENSLLVANTPGMQVRPGSMGRPTPGHRIAVIDGAGAAVAPGVEGDLALLGTPPTLFAGYWRDPEATLATRRAGWYVTGDRAVADADGYLWFTGRADDVIVSAGYRIGPFEVESALLEHPAVAESAVVAKPDPDRGHIVKAFVVARPGIETGAELARALQEHVKAVTAPYMYPREVEFVAELPKTTSGKIRRVELRALEAARAEAGDPVEPGPAAPAEVVAHDAARIAALEAGDSRKALTDAERAAFERIESERMAARRLAEEVEARLVGDRERERVEAVDRAREDAEQRERNRLVAEARARAEARRHLRAEAPPPPVSEPPAADEAPSAVEPPADAADRQADDLLSRLSAYGRPPATPTEPD